MSSSRADISGANRALAAVPRLKGKDTYPRWSSALKLYFKKSKSWGVISGSEPRPSVVAAVGPSTATGATAPATNLEAIEVWEDKDNEAKFDIVSTVSDEQQNKLYRLPDTATSKEFWDLLEKDYALLGTVGKQVLAQQLWSLRLQDSKSMEEHLAKMRDTAARLDSIGEGLPTSTLLVAIKASLPESWKPILFLLDSMKSDDLDEICARLIDADEREKLVFGNTKGSSNKNPAALAAAPTKDKSKSKCFNCGKNGHYSRDCTKPPSEATLAARNKKALLTSTSPTDAARTYALAITVGKANFAPATSDDDDDPTTSYESWVLDSGAACHFTGERDSLANFVESTKVVVADNSTVTSPGYGTAILLTEKGDRLKLSRVLHLPGAQQGLLSVSALVEAGATVSFASGPSNGVVKMGNKVIVSTIEGKGYVLNAKLLRSGEHSQSAVTHAFLTREKESASLMTWHRRLGHIAPSTILAIASEEMVKGLSLSDKKIEDCESCIVAKSKRSPFTATSTPAEGVLDRVFMDLGFVEDPDREGRKTYLVLVDQYSNARWTFPLASKHAAVVFEHFQTWKTGIESLTGRKLRRIRSDNGSEFVNSTFSKFFKDEGILHEMTAPYTPEQNGQVERLNGSLMALVKAMLHDAKLGKEYWSFALDAATYVSNRSAHPRIKGKTIYEVFMGHRPAIGHLRPFGAVTYVHVEKALRKKLDATAVKGRFVGYSGEYNYLVLLEDGKVVTTRHATFGHSEESELVVPPSALEPVAAEPEQEPLPPLEPIDDQQVPVPPADGHEYVLVRTGPNPGALENVDPANILEGGRRTRGRFATIEELVEPETIYARLAIVHDSEEPDKEGSWEEDSVFVGVAMPETPRSYAEAMASPHKTEWVQAMNDEWDAFAKHQVLAPATLPLGSKALGTTWVFTLKTLADGSRRYKARLVAQGFAQRPGIDVNETFAPVVRASTIRYLVAVAASKRLDLVHFDFNTAFLNGRMTEDVFIRVPHGYPGKVADGQVLKLVGSMYGTKQAPREWYHALKALMGKQGYVAAFADPCVFTKSVAGSLIVMAIYVDDGLALSSDSKLISSELSALNKVYSLKVLGPVSTFLALEVEHLQDGLFIHHSKYVSSMLERFGITIPSRARANTPMEERYGMAPDSSPAFNDIKLYQSAVSSLMFTATYVRADIAVAVRAVAQRVISPTENDWSAVKRIFLYLSNTVDYGILYQRDTPIGFAAYSDASWADDLESRRSVGGYVVLVAGGAISWRSKQQTLVATSTTESELLAASDATKEVIALRRLATDLGHGTVGPTTIFEDNAAAIAIAENPTSHGRTKHFDVQQLFVRERTTSGDIKLVYISTHDMVADTLTKALGRVKFEFHRDGMGFRSLSTLRGRSVGGAK